MTITRLVPLSPPWAIAVTNRGPAGVSATIAVDPDVTVLAPNEPGEVENIGNATHAIFKFSLPKGGTGDVGPAPSLDIGTVTTVPNGNAADAEIVGGDGDYELNLTIPAGPTGPPPTLDIGDVESGVTADAEITGGDGEYELNLTLPIGPPPVLLPGTVTAVDNGDPLVMTLTETGPGEYTLDIEVPEGPQGVPGSMSPGDAVTLLNMATARMLGRTTAGTGVVQELTAANVRSFINVADGANVSAAADFANDNRLLRSDGATKGVKASGVSLDDANVISGAAAVYATLVQGAQLSMPDTGQDHAALFQMGTNLTAARTYTLGMPDGSYTYTFPEASANLAALNLEDQTQIGGVRVTPKNLGNLSGNTLSIDPGDRSIQSISNNGAGTISPSAFTGHGTFEVINTTGAAVPTTSAWTYVDGIFDATTTSKFMCFYVITANMSVLTIMKVA